MSDVSLVVAVAATSRLSPLWIVVVIALHLFDGLPAWWLKVLLAVEETRRLKRPALARSRRRNRRRAAREDRR